MKRSTTAMIFALSLLAGRASAALAQGRSRTISGIVVDESSLKPLSQAIVYVGRTVLGQRTGGDGTFHVSAAGDAALVLVRRSGYVPVVITVPADTVATETNVGTTTLAQVKTDEDRALVLETDVRMFPELIQFYNHRAQYRQGIFLAPDDLGRVGGGLFNFLRQKPGFHFICYETRKGDVDCGRKDNRGPTSIMNPHPTSREEEPCGLEVWTNALGPQRTLDEIQMDDVLAVEAYPHPGVTPPEFNGSPCATIMLWMKQAGGLGAHPR